jgi:cbb3-type cytochrome oxidase maturation protein
VNALLMLIPVALLLGLLGLGGFLWALKSGQFEDLDGAANRILFDDDEMAPPSNPTPNPADSSQASVPKDGGHG